MAISEDRKSGLLEQYAYLMFTGTEADRKAFLDDLTPAERRQVEASLHNIASAWVRDWAATIHEYRVRDAGERAVYNEHCAAEAEAEAAAE